MHPKILIGFIFVLTANRCLSKQANRLTQYVCENLGDAACLNHRSTLIQCVPQWGCDFIFSCPADFQQNQTICTHHTNDPCPNINQIRYDVRHPIDDIHNVPEAKELTPSESNKCRYTMEEFFQTGLPVARFTLAFDRTTAELVLFAAFNLGLEQIECYSRDVWGISPVNLQLVISRTRETFRRYLLEIHEAPYIYFCVVSAPSVFVRTRTEDAVAFSNTSGNRYISKIVILPDNIKIFADMLENFCKITIFHNCKVIKWSKDDTYFHIFFYFQDLTLISFERIQNFLQTHVLGTLQQTKNRGHVAYLTNVEYCLPNVTTINGITLHWNTTLVGTVATPRELCFDNNGMLVTRRCDGDFFTGAVWSEPSGVCSDEIEIPERTSRLHQLIGKDTITEVFSDITEVTDQFQEFTPADVNLLSEGFKSMSVTRNVRGFKGDFLRSVSNTMRVNSSVLRESQEQLNSTDKILDSIENFVINIAEDMKNLSTTIESNVLTHITYPFISNVIGLALYKKGEEDFDQYEIRDIKFDQTFEDLPLEDLELAVYVSSDFIRKVTNNLTAQEKDAFQIINTVFYNDGLFNDISNKNRSAGSRVINVNIPSLGRNVETPISILFRPILNFTDPNCVYWDYGRQRLGEWSTSGGKILGKYGINETLLQCTFDHITHFALLVLRGNIITTENGTQINSLEPYVLFFAIILGIIIIMGYVLSLIGLLIILLSALIFKDWYKKRLYSIQLAIVVMMQVIVPFVADMGTLEDTAACMAVSALLHYIVLAKFTWMLIIARLQYLKYVKIFENLQVKSHTAIYMKIGWVMPIIPVVLAMLIFPDNYKAGDFIFCHPESNALYFFLILPIFAIFMINMAIFSTIIVMVIVRSTAQDYGVDMLKVKMRLFILLFFVLGIPGIFRILPMLLVPWQGFVLFVFIVLLDKTTVELWRGFFRTTPRDPTSYERSTRSQVLYSTSGGNATVNYFGRRD